MKLPVLLDIKPVHNSDERPAALYTLAGYPQVTDLNFQATVFIVLFFTQIYNCLYRYAPHNDVSVNDEPHIRQWSHNIII